MSQAPSHDRRGFTLVELLVVIAIIGVLIGLLLPSIQAARESARRSSCRNNFKQLGLAMQGYHDVRRGFPYGVSETQGVDHPFKATSSSAVFRGGATAAGDLLNYHVRDMWFHRVLAFVEQGTLSDLYEADRAWFVHHVGVTWNPRVASRSLPVTPIAMYKCPSDPTAPGRRTATSFTGFLVGNYAVCYGSGGHTGTSGVFGRRTSPRAVIGSRIKDCTDGTSKTLMASEGIVRGPDGGQVQFGEFGSYWYGGAWGEYGFSTQEPPNTTVADVNWQCLTTTWPSAPCSVDTTAANQRNYARSMHAGGVNVLFCDGSVRDVVDTINATVWRNLGDKSDGEAVGDF